MNKIILIIIIIIIIISFTILVINNNQYELMTNISNEAIQDIASVYNKNNLIVTNLTSSNGSIGDIKITNGWDALGPSHSNQISNDSATYKALMIAGNDSAGGNRKINLYDDVLITKSLKVADRNILNEIDSLKAEINALKTDITNNYIKKGYMTLVRSYCENGACGEKKYLNLNNLPLVDSNSGGGYDKLTIVGQ